MTRFYAIATSSAFLALLSPAVFAEKPKKTPEAKASAPVENGKFSTIWKVSDKDSYVYLAGSVHLLREKDLPIPSAFDAVYEDSEELVFEVDMEKMTNPAVAMEIMKLGSLPEGESLSDRLSEETIKLLNGYLAERSMPSVIFDRFKPGMVYLTLSSLEAARMGARPELGLETTYFKKSQMDGKPSRGLETIEFQMACFDRFEDAQVDEFIKKSIEDIDKGPEAFDSIIASWKSGDADAMAALVVEQTAPTPDVQEVLLIERNKNWITDIEKALEANTKTMFLVGAAHLVGEGSVIELLEAKGLSTEQVENP